MVLKDENRNGCRDNDDLPQQVDILFFNSIVHYISCDPSLYDEEYCNYRKTIVYEATLRNHLNYKASLFNVHVLWENGEETDEPQLQAKSKTHKKAKPQAKVKLCFQ